MPDETFIPFGTSALTQGLFYTTALSSWTHHTPPAVSGSHEADAGDGDDDDSEIDTLSDPAEPPVRGSNFHLGADRNSVAGLARPGSVSVRAKRDFCATLLRASRPGYCSLKDLYSGTSSNLLITVYLARTLAQPSAGVSCVLQVGGQAPQILCRMLLARDLDWRCHFPAPGIRFPVQESNHGCAVLRIPPRVFLYADWYKGLSGSNRSI